VTLTRQKPSIRTSRRWKEGNGARSGNQRKKEEGEGKLHVGSKSRDLFQGPLSKTLAAGGGGFGKGGGREMEGRKLVRGSKNGEVQTGHTKSVI